MTDPYAVSEAARALNRQRWGDTVLRRAVSTVEQRADQLDDGLRAELQAVVSSQDGDDAINHSFGAGVPFTPEEPRRETDREWITGYRRRLQASRMNPAEAAERVGQNADLGRAFGGRVDRGQRRALGRANVERMLADAAEANSIAAYKRERRETLELIDRARLRLPRRGFPAPLAALPTVPSASAWE